MSLDWVPRGQHLYRVSRVSWRRLVSLPVVLLLALLFLGTSRPGAEATVIYSYTGQNFTDFFGGGYTVADKVTGSFSVADILLPQPILLPLPQPAILSYSFSDGVNTVNNSNSHIDFSLFRVDAAGNIVEWAIGASINGPSQSSGCTNGEPGCRSVNTENFHSRTLDFGIFVDNKFDSHGGISFVPGSWSLAASPQLSQPEKDLHQRQGELAQTVSEIAFAASLITAASAKELLIGLADRLTSVPDTLKYVTYGLLAVGFVGAIVSGNLTAMALASLAITGAVAGVMAESHFGLAADPPDPNFKQVAQYSNARPVLDFGLGAEANERFATFYASLIRAAEASRFALISLERLQAALAAGDLEAAAQQRLAYAIFAGEIATAEADAGRQAAMFRVFLASQGLSDVAILGALDTFADAIAPTPEPTTLLLVGTTAAGFGWARWRQRKRGKEAVTGD